VWRAVDRRLDAVLQSLDWAARAVWTVITARLNLIPAAQAGS